jgi:pyruvate/2-oxoglutarate/acetoin dehydrogenase E1 component
MQAELTGGLIVHLRWMPQGLALVSCGKAIASPIADDCFARLDAHVRRVGSTDPFAGYTPRTRGTRMKQTRALRDGGPSFVLGDAKR